MYEIADGTPYREICPYTSTHKVPRNDGATLFITLEDADTA